MSSTIEHALARSPSRLSLSDRTTMATETAPADVVRNSGAIGWLIDADLARETAQLLDLQNRQRRRAALSDATPAPRTLLSLFGGA
jgi:hypothetical protein